MLQTISIIITGKVQGVFFRQSSSEKASGLGITGKVMNLPDGNVQIIATGTREKLNLLIDWCKQGPPKAKVTGVDVKELSLQMFDHFIIERY